MLVVLQRKDGSGVTFDATPQEGHSSRATATKFPVERPSGGVSSISDHVVDEPDVLNLNAVVGAEPFVVGVGQPESEQRARDAYDELRAMKGDGTLLKAITLLRTYNDMVITSIDVSVTATTHDSMVASISLTQVRTVASERTAVLPGRVRQDGRRTGKTAPKQPTQATNATELRKAATALVGANNANVLDSIARTFN